MNLSRHDSIAPRVLKSSQMAEATSDYAEEDVKTEALYESVRAVLNKLTPQNVERSANQLTALEIDTKDRLQGVANLLYEKAIDTPRSSVAVARMCRELTSMHVSGPDGKTEKEETNVNLRKLIITRCQMEFEKNTVDETAKAIKLKEIDATTDPEKELVLTLEEEKKRMRIKSVGNIRFLGELYKQGMLTSNIMHRCMRHLVKQIDKESLECLCVLLSTVGKDMECKEQNLDTYFDHIMDILNGKVPGTESPQLRFVLQYVIELRMNNWVPSRDDNNPKIIDQIQKEAETERLDTHMNNMPMNTPRKDDRNNDRKRNRGGGPAELDGWTSPVRGSRQQYSAATRKLKNKPPPMDNLQLGNKNMFQRSRNVLKNTPKTVTPIKYSVLDTMPSAQDRRTPLPLSGSRSTGPGDYGRSDYKSSYDGRKSRKGSQRISSRSYSKYNSLHDSSPSQSMPMPPPQPIKSVPPPAPVPVPIEATPTLTEEQLTEKTTNILNEYLTDTNIDNAFIEIRETFDNSTFANFVREALNYVVEKSATVRQQVSQLMTHLIVKETLPLSLYLTGLGEVLETAEDLVIDIPKIWVYLAELIWYPLAEDTIPFSELSNIMAPLKNAGLAGKLLAELLTLLVQEKDPNWIKERWQKSGLQWSDFLQEYESVPDFIKKYKLEFMVGGSNSELSPSGEQLGMKRVQELLFALLSNEKEYSFDNITSWITANVGSSANQPQFIRVLVTAILKASFEPHNDGWQFNEDKFGNLQPMIARYVDADELLEPHCLLAIREYIHKLEQPKSVLLQVISKLW